MKIMIVALSITLLLRTKLRSIDVIDVLQPHRELEEYCGEQGSVNCHVFPRHSSMSPHGCGFNRSMHQVDSIIPSVGIAAVAANASVALGVI
jgi:hypothetical protein